MGGSGRLPVMSIVIPTVGRAHQLANTLSALRDLDPATPPWEAIVVLDGPDPATSKVLHQARTLPLTIIELPPRGIGPAKNRGGEEARGELILFLNDDTRPHPECLLHHYRAQQTLGPCLTLGRVEWEPTQEITPYMAWLAPGGHQFNYARLCPEQPVCWDACWGPNLALPRAWLLDEPLDPGHPFPALEDTEWGFRQARRGRTIRYVPGAVAFHDHHYRGPSDFRRRALLTGQAGRHVARQHPELRRTLVWRPAAAALVRLLSMAYPGHWSRRYRWDLDYRLHVLQGLLTRERR